MSLPVSEVVTYEVVDGVAWLTIARPEARNALSRDVREGLWEGTRRFVDDDTAAVLVLTGAQTVVRVKIEPDLRRSLAVVHTDIRNGAADRVTLAIRQSIDEWRGAGAIAAALNFACRVVSPACCTVSAASVTVGGPLDPVGPAGPCGPVGPTAPPGSSDSHS